MYPCCTYVWKIYSTFSAFEVKMTLTVYGLALSYLALELLPYYDKSY